MKYIYIVSIFIFINACNNPSKVSNKNATFNAAINDSLQFKHWLRDTISALDGNNRNMMLNVPIDSTYLEIEKKYDTIVSPIDKMRNKDLELALYLLKTNDVIPNEDFKLNFTIIYYYDISPIHLKYDSTYEIKKFQIQYNENIYGYKFIKGNMISKNKL